MMSTINTPEEYKSPCVRDAIFLESEEQVRGNSRTCSFVASLSESVCHAGSALRRA